MYDVVAFYKNVATSGSLTKITPISDNMYHVSGDDLLMKKGKEYLVWAAAHSTNVIRGQLRKPQFGDKYVNIQANRDYNSLFKYFAKNFFIQKPLKLTPDEPLNVYVASDDSGSAEDLFTILFFSSTPKIVRPLDYDYVLRLTGSTTTTGKNWTVVDLTPDVTLAEGTYEIVGMIPYSTNLLAARIIDPNSSNRPGVVGYRTEQGALGFFPGVGLYTGVRFKPRSIPKMEWLSFAADSSEVIYWFLKKVG